jgi:NADH-quinone oxidoreductase subunit C
MTLQDIAQKMKQTLKNDFLGYKVVLDELIVMIESQSIAKVLTYLRDNEDFQFRQLIDICGVDYPERVKRFEVVYHLLSLKYNWRLRLKVSVEEGVFIPTICSVYSAANWFEREVFDMFGIQFEGHPDLRRLLTDYGFEGYPLRKDFPLTGHVEVHYDDEQKRVVYDKVNLPQAYRDFDFLSPWEGMTPDRVLPGDEKATKGE